MRLEDFFRSIPQIVCFKNDAETGDSSDTSTVFDFTSQNLTSPGFDLGSFSSESKENGTYISEHVWIFDAHPDRFLLSLDERQDTVGARFLKASSLIRQCVEVPLKGQQENRIEFPNVDSETFKVVLSFLVTGTLPIVEFGALKKLYKFSQLYEMEDLQRRCAEEMLVPFKTVHLVPNTLGSHEEKELEGIADTYSDIRYLLKTNVNDFDNDLPLLLIDDRSNYDCYI
ncbi:hypothetical protein AVEN_211283-1 [Araneus ventricosus]|uniref:BTB domain-containing protein n=1 Tax=Araneus ventricosus TaxID=182803 RepID=A0A4Y2HNS6_ARAVE|nr:hypothetical protein AVEN_211283-1 [Araneus ventricosus]